ncbi:amino acid transporter [Herbaspirillum sp. Sphag1AN]|uniref:amino acid permease n=1 Tax=unclassified Herbaspirillum TaxID=2624150 RepID=UPI0017B6BBAB|nr:MULTISPECIES: amino acid permease [unclassified Herbaspirillum]MBB3210852.1 amino acid transporter [Herbaspirillum sp. Sphag1AN]MBB3244482.1 amino acid transporter [Herbaspirillum sp. Sphag64]
MAAALSTATIAPDQIFSNSVMRVQIGFFLALAAGGTVFLIALAYGQVTALFPAGGSGYRIAGKLLGGRAALIAGAALFLNYVVMIDVVIMAAVETLSSLLRLDWQPNKLWLGAIFLAVLVTFNLRGVRVSPLTLTLFSLAFAATHLILIFYGVMAHANSFSDLISAAPVHVAALIDQLGWSGLISVLVPAYALGGVSYAAVEALSGSVHYRRRLRLAIGKLSLLVVVLILAVMAAGLCLLYLLWDVHPAAGQTIVATIFAVLIDSLGVTPPWLHQLLLIWVLGLQVLLLLLVANLGFAGGRAMLSHMAADSWVPHQFRYLSTPLVSQNGVFLMAFVALVTLAWAGGELDTLMIVYSLWGLLAMTISLSALCRYWWLRRRLVNSWHWQLSLSVIALAISVLVLAQMLLIKPFNSTGMAIILLLVLSLLCFYIRANYRQTKRAIRALDQVFASQPFGMNLSSVPVQPEAPTAVFIVGTSRGSGLHALLWVQRMFPGHFRNFIFVNARTAAIVADAGADTLTHIRVEANATLQFFVEFCRSHELASAAYLGFGSDAVEEVSKLCQEVSKDYPQSIFFASKLIFDQDNWFIRLLHNQAALAIQRRLHTNGLQMLILPMKL